MGVFLLFILQLLSLLGVHRTSMPLQESRTHLQRIVAGVSDALRLILTDSFVTGGQQRLCLNYIAICTHEIVTQLLHNA